MCERAFQELKMRFTSTPILIVPEGGQMYTVYCDASKDGWFSAVKESRAELPYA